MAGKSEEKIDLTGGQLELFNQLHGADQMAVEKLKVCHVPCSVFAPDYIRNVLHQYSGGLRFQPTTFCAHECYTSVE